MPDETQTPQNWRESLPETYESGKDATGNPVLIPLRASKTLEKFADVGALARGYIEAEQAISKKTDGLVRIPGEQATPEEVGAYRKALGIPDSANEYKLAVPDGLKSLVPDEMAAKFSPIFHAAHIPPAVGNKIVQAYGEHVQALIAQRQQEFAAARDALKQEWGDATWERRNILAERAIEKLLTDEQIALFNGAGLSGHPEVLKLFATLGETMAEDGIISGETVPGRTKADAERRMQEISTDPDFMNKYRNPAKHELLKKEWNELFDLLNPEPISAGR